MGAPEIQVLGVESLRRLQADLRQADPKLRKELYRALARATKPLGDLAREEALTLPSGGGLAGLVSKGMRIRTKMRAGANPSVRLEATAISAATSVFHKARRKAIRKTRQRQKLWRLHNGKATAADLKGGQFRGIGTIGPARPRKPRKSKPKE